MKFSLKARHWTVIGALLALMAAAVTGLVVTREQAAESAAKRAGSKRRQYVDLSLLQTARQLATSATSRDEMRYAREALRLADHQVDLAFSVALREAVQQKAAATPETRALFDRVKEAEAAVKEDQDQVDGLKKQLASTPLSRQDAVQQRISLAQAQLELDQDELQDAQGDLYRSGADPQIGIQRQFARYQASAQHDQDLNNLQPGSANRPEAETSSTLLGQLGVWQRFHGRSAQLNDARQAALSAAEDLRKTHDTLEADVQSLETEKQQLKAEAINQLESKDDAAGSASTAASLKEFANKQKTLSDLDKRMQDHQELADTYASWIGVVKANERSAMHRLMVSVIWIILIVLVVYLACRVIDHFLEDVTHERRTLRTLRVIFRFAVQALGVLCVVFVLVGTPNQMPTIIGLAGAGLTVALKDFIVAFFGWFVLMGKNGIRAGDWVEINGVVGEVVEVNWLRTVLLETGNWTDSGHPTGRKVAFVNSFAIEGHFFNFSTSGQWLWDELQLEIPSGRDPYSTIEEIQKLVAQETAASARGAEEEWKRSTSRYRVQSVSAKPTISLRPTGAGVEVHLRYITTANERYAMRAHLYQVLVELLHGKKPTSTETHEEVGGSRH